MDLREGFDDSILLEREYDQLYNNSFDRYSTFNIDINDYNVFHHPLGHLELSAGHYPASSVDTNWYYYRPRHYHRTLVLSMVSFETSCTLKTPTIDKIANDIRSRQNAITKTKRRTA